MTAEKGNKKTIIAASIVLVLVVGLIVIIMNMNLFNPVQTNTPNKSSLKLVKMGPVATEPGVKFQVLPNGESAMWVIGENITETTKIVWQKTRLNTRYKNSTTLSARVPDALYAKEGKYEIYLLDTKTKAVSNKLVFSVMKKMPLKLFKMGPTSTKVNQLFNKQPNGLSAMWVIGDGITQDTKVVWEKTELKTGYKNPTTLTALVPTELISKPGKYSICLIDSKTKAKSNSLFFVVE